MSQENKIPPAEVRKEFEKIIRPKINMSEKQCQYCGENAVHIHHLIPISFGGDNRKNNLIPLCSQCHEKLHNNKFGEDWKAAQKAGIERAKIEGKFRGGQIKKIPKDKYIELKNKWQTREITKIKFAELLGVSRPTLDKILKEEELYLKDFDDTACTRAAEKLVLVR